MISEIYLDMDGCIVDFDETAFRVLNHTPSAKSGSWIDMHKHHHKTIEEHPGFWEDMKWMPDGKQLWNGLAGYSPHILSAYPRHWGEKNIHKAIVGKRHWILNNLGNIPEKRINIVARNQKKDFAFNIKTHGPNLLIDDLEKNCREWRQAGGIAILHVSADETLKKLTEMKIYK